MYQIKTGMSTWGTALLAAGNPQICGRIGSPEPDSAKCRPQFLHGG
jgi:hypothetical protein